MNHSTLHLRQIVPTFLHDIDALLYFVFDTLSFLKLRLKSFDDELDLICSAFLESISTAFYEELFHQFPFANEFLTQNVSTEKHSKTLWYEKGCS